MDLKIRVGILVITTPQDWAWREKPRFRLLYTNYSYIHTFYAIRTEKTLVECVWNLMAHGEAREGKWRGNWRKDWVASTLTLTRNVVYPALLPLMRTTRVPAIDWTDAPADLNGLVRFGERRNLVSARVPSRFKRTQIIIVVIIIYI